MPRTVRRIKWPSKAALRRVTESDMADKMRLRRVGRQGSQTMASPGNLTTLTSVTLRSKRPHEVRARPERAASAEITPPTS